MSYTRFPLSPVFLLLLFISASFMLSFCPTPDEYFAKGEEAKEKKDYRTSLAYYTKAADAGHAEAMYRIGMITMKGLISAPDTCAAVEWIRKAAEAGSVDAECDYGMCLIYNYCSEDKDLEGHEWLKKAIEHGSGKAKFIVGKIYYTGGPDGVVNYQEALRWFMDAAESGYTDGMVFVGWCYYYGHGTDKDRPMAVEWFTKAAEHGNTDGMFILGNCLQNGNGTSVDLPKAADWYKKAAEAGQIFAMINYGVTCETGLGIQKNLPEAFKWYRGAAEAGQEVGQYHLAKCYLYSIGVNQDLNQAESWALKSLNQGYELAQKLLDTIAELRKKPKKEDDDDWELIWWKILRSLRIWVPEHGKLTNNPTDETLKNLRPLGTPEKEFKLRRVDPRRLYKPNGQSVGYGPEFHPNGWMPQLLEKPGSHTLLGAFYASKGFTFGKGREYNGSYLNGDKTGFFNTINSREAEKEYDSGFRLNNEYGLIMNLNEPIVDGKMTPFTIYLDGFGWVKDTYGVLHKKSTRPLYMHAHSIVKIFRVSINTAWVVTECLRSGQMDYVKIMGSSNGSVTWKNIGMLTPAHKGAPCHLCHGYGRSEIQRRYDKHIKAAAQEYTNQKRHIAFGDRYNTKYISTYNVKKVQPLANNGVRLYISFQYDRLSEDNLRTADLMRYDVYQLPNGKFNVLPPVDWRSLLTLETQVNLFEEWE